MQSAARPINESKHPLCQQRYIIPTPSIENYYTQVKRCIRLKVPGATTYALPRYGKTRCIMYCVGAIKADFPKLPVYQVLCPKKGTSSEGAFFSEMLRAVGHEKPNAGLIAAKRGRLYKFLIEQGERSDYKSIVSFFDESQKLSMTEYEWLRDIHDELDQNGIRYLTFMVGQEQLKHQKFAMREEGAIQIIQRFMLDELKFRGIRNPDELATCLHEYDVASYPPNSDWTYTRFFLPKAYDNGFRMLDCAELMWDVFSAAHEETNPAAEIDIPMTYFTRAVECILVENQDNDNDRFRIDETICVNAVNFSKFTQSQVELKVMQLMEE